MKKICIITTGGTIGSCAQNGIISLDKSLVIANLYKAEFTCDFEFDVKTPYNILSENIEIDNAEQLYHEIKSLDLSLYQGIVITHGTDTLAYMSNYLGIMLSKISLPVVMVSSNYPVQDKDSNALANFDCAINFIAQNIANGVFVAYQNSGEVTKMHLGTRLLQARQVDGYFDSLCSKYFAEFIDGKFIVKENLPDNTCGINSDGKLCNDILFLKAHAFMNFNILDFSNKKPKAVVIELYHSGTIDTEGENSFLPFVQYCNSYDVDVIISTASIEDEIYSSFAKLTYAKLTICKGISVEMALIKSMLFYAYPNNKNPNIFSINYFHENLIFGKN